MKPYSNLPYGNLHPRNLPQVNQLQDSTYEALFVEIC